MPNPTRHSRAGGNPETLITDNLNIWTAAIKKRGSQGRGTSKKIELYGIKKLRELILELAVRGLLVPQDSNDEPASVLLEKIATEKEQLIKDGKIKKEKPLPEIGEDEKPFELPKGWEWVHFQDISEYIQRGKGPKYSESGSVRVVSQKCVQASGFDMTPARYVEDESLEKYQPERFLKDNDLLWNSTGTGTVGRINVISGFEYGSLVADSHVTVIRTLLMDTRFIWSYISAPGVQSRIEPTHENALVSGSTKQVELNTSSVTSLLVPIPPEAEQPRIVAKVDELMALCDQLEQQTETSLLAHQTLVDNLLKSLLGAAQLKPGHNSSVGGQGKNNDPFQSAWNLIADHFNELFTTEHSIDQLKQTILQLAVMGKLVPQNPNDEPASKLLEKIAAEKERLIKDGKIKKQKPLPEIDDSNKLEVIPLGWVYAYMQDISKVVTCGMASTPKYQEKGRMFLSAKNIKPNKFMPEEHKYVDEETFRKITQNAFPEKGDILLTRVGAGIGEAAVIDQEIEFAFYVSLTLVKPFLNFLNSYYLLIWLNSPQGVKKSLDNIYGAGVSQGNLNVNQVRSFEVPLAPIEEQGRIVAKVDELMALCDTLKERIRESEGTKLHLADAMAEQALNE